MPERNYSDHESAQKLVPDYDFELSSPPCKPGAATWSARVTLETDIDEVLPYLNARLDGAYYDHNAKILIWKDQGHSFAYRSREIKASPARDREEARDLIARAVALANDTWEDRNNIEPSFEKRTLPNMMQIYRLLPRTNCGECGFVTCMAYAAALREGDTELGCCPALAEEAYSESQKELVELLKPVKPGL
jgi:ArsR family metal-binding transcriptional regulator